MTLILVYVAYAILLNVALSRRGVPIRPALASTPAPAASKIAVIGATGGTGRALVQQALERHYVVTVLVREPRRLTISHPRLRVVQGNVLDYRAVADVVRGQDAVVCTLGHKRYFYPARILSEGTRNILKAMDEAGVRRLICQTSLGIGYSAGRMGLYYTCFVIPVILPFYFWDKTRQERLIADSRAAWTIVRPVALTNAAALGRCRDGFHVGHWLWTPRVPRGDVARFLLDQLSDDKYLGVAVGVSS